MTGDELARYDGAVLFDVPEDWVTMNEDAPANGCDATYAPVPEIPVATVYCTGVIGHAGAHYAQVSDDRAVASWVDEAPGASRTEP